MKRNISIAITATVALVTAGLVAYKVSTDGELRNRVIRSFQDAFAVSKQKINGMSEDVAMRTAQMTRNPKINQEWVSQQWDAIGY